MNNEKTADVIGLHETFPLTDVLSHLINAAEYLLHKKDYDGHDYEEIAICVRRAKEIKELLDKHQPDDEAVRFADWIEREDWKKVYSTEIEKDAWVNASEHKIYEHGSEDHFIKLITKYGFTTQQLFEQFKTKGNG